MPTMQLNVRNLVLRLAEKLGKAEERPQSKMALEIHRLEVSYT